MGNIKSKIWQRTPGGSEDAEIDPVEKKKKDRKSIECEVFGFGDEAAESAAAWKDCRKNPDHVTFIPAPEFGLEHLPPDYREVPVLDFITAVSALTVRLRVDVVSHKRPKGYAFAENRGSRVPHVGSGLVRRASVGQGPCPCRTCSGTQNSSPSSSPKWFEISVGSACHVLYNSEEALATRVDFFYDHEHSRKDGQLKSAKGFQVTEKDRKSDVCFFTCITHDEGLFTRLQSLLDRFESCRKNLPKELPSESLMMVVSHPHGQPKKITVGELVKHKVIWAEPRALALTWTLLYRADTCAGSSGAPVFEISSKTRYGRNGYVYSVGTFHSGWESKGNHSVRIHSSYSWESIF
ncbi:hypothetical protein ElyMa_001006800 [Elysia marginata]|uniref:Peptidase S1 domain-containing protein n=1 Tax=Elysia marginata TaxID=1093978 RepID=A0AAV4HIH6_9GAST|nr:hypothetical protein ElyMa_001006800 [Elysia marginata]